MKSLIKLLARNIGNLNKVAILGLLIFLPLKSQAMDIGETFAESTYTTYYARGDFDAKKELADEENALSSIEENEDLDLAATPSNLLENN